MRRSMLQTLRGLRSPLAPSRRRAIHSGAIREHAFRGGRGFTLVEMVVVIAVILVLVALTVTVGVSVVRGSEVRQTQNLLTQLDGIVQEWQLASGRTVRYGINGEPCNQGEVYELTQLFDGNQLPPLPDPTGIDLMEETTDELFLILLRSTEAQEMIARINPEFVSQEEHNGETFVHVRDPWGNLIFAVLPGRTFQRPIPGCLGDSGDPDSDGTIRTAFENRFGVCNNRTIFFVSAGPDGEFGDLSAAPDTIEFKRTRDNIYSTPPEMP